MSRASGHVTDPPVILRRPLKLPFACASPNVSWVRESLHFPGSVAPSASPASLPGRIRRLDAVSGAPAGLWPRRPEPLRRPRRLWVSCGVPRVCEVRPHSRFVACLSPGEATPASSPASLARAGFWLRRSLLLSSRRGLQISFLSGLQ